MSQWFWLPGMKLVTVVSIIFVAAGICGVEAQTISRSYQPKYPIVFVPGILGSQLCEGNEVVWGGDGLASLRNFWRLDFLLQRGVPIKPCGLVSKIQVLGPLYSVDAYVKLQQSFAEWGLIEGEDLHIFSYDWRRSNEETAEELENFINQRIGTAGKVDILSHSMGGIVTRLYIDRVKNNQRVNKAIYMGTPFLGSMNTLGTLSEGWGAMPNWLAGGIEGVRSTALSFPAMLELLPRYKNCCSIKLSNGKYSEIDVFDIGNWRKYRWLPTRYTRGDDQIAFNEALIRAKRLSQTLSTPPIGVDEVRIAGRAKDTRFIFTVKEGRTEPSGDNWYFSMQGGDGTVPIWSAARNVSLKDISGSLPSFSEHATIFDDPAVVEQLERELFPIPADLDRPIAGTGNPALAVTVNGQARYWTVERARIVLKETYVLVGSSVEAEIVLTLSSSAQDVQANVFKPVVSLREGENTTVMAVTDVTTPSDTAAKMLVFRAKSAAVLGEGIGVVLLKFPGSGELREFVVVLQ